jgi:hypothetical protein
MYMLLNNQIIGGLEAMHYASIIISTDITILTENSIMLAHKKYLIEWQIIFQKEKVISTYY